MDTIKGILGKKLSNAATSVLTLALGVALTYLASKYLFPAMFQDTLDRVKDFQITIER